MSEPLDDPDSARAMLAAVAPEEIAAQTISTRHSSGDPWRTLRVALEAEGYDVNSCYTLSFDESQIGLTGWVVSNSGRERMLSFDLWKGRGPLELTSASWIGETELEAKWRELRGTVDEIIAQLR